jgi:hypothetical protein
MTMLDDDAGDAPWALKTTFHLETVPGHPRLLLLADSGVTRYAHLPVARVPASENGRPRDVTLWLRPG